MTDLSEKKLRRAEQKIAILERMIEDKTRHLYLASTRFEALGDELRQCRDSLPGMMIGVEGSGGICRVNRTTLEMLGCSAPDLVGRPFSEVCDPKDVAELLRVAREGGAVRRETRYRGKDGRCLDVMVSSAHVSTEASSEPWISLIAIDISEHKAVEEELFQARKFEAVGQLAAGIAHEVNTPIQFIGDNLRFLQDAFPEMVVLMANQGRNREGEEEGRLDFVLREIVTACRDSLEGIEQIRKIVVAMKEFAHPDSRECVPVDLNRVVESTVAVSRNEWKHVAELSCDLDATLPLVLGHRSELNQVVLNLVVNAAHAVSDVIAGGQRPMGTIRVTTRHEGAFAELRIADSGTGIREEVRPRIFDPFFTTKGVGKGTGQGLTLVRSIVVSRHHGSIRFETEVGKGTTFVVQLPIEGARPTGREARG
jgi:PAS domain S-box-containing protein